MTQNTYRRNALLLCVLWAIEDSLCSQEKPTLTQNQIMNIATRGSSNQFNQMVKAFPEAVHTKGDINNTPLHEIVIWSATLSLPEALRRAQRLIKIGADVNVQNNHGNTPLHLAADRGLLEVVKLFVQHGAKVNTQNGERYSRDNTPLHLALEKRHEQVAQFLLAQEDIAVDTKNSAQCTPLHCAVEKGLIDTIQCLIEKGAPLDARTQNGLTPLHCAAASGREDIVSFLIAHGADVRSIENGERTPLHLATFANRCAPAQLLLQAGSDINAPDSHKSTPLHLAVLENNLETVRFLVSNGADVDAIDDQNRTPLKIAIVIRHNREVAHLLIERGAATDFLATRNIIRSQLGWQGTFLLNWKKIQKETRTQRLAALDDLRIFPQDVDKLILALAFNDVY